MNICEQIIVQYDLKVGSERGETRRKSVAFCHLVCQQRRPEKKKTARREGRESLKLKGSLSLHLSRAETIV